MFKKLFFTFIILSLLAVNFAWVDFAKADPAPYFSLTASEGQGGSSNEFYVGRCFRVNINLHTGGNNTNGADVEINYDDTILQAVQSNCSSAATTVYTDGLFDVYPAQGNSISDGSILVSAYNNPGNSTNVSDQVYGHLFFKVLTASSSYDLDFEYTQGLTTDTNLAQTGGDGSDILQSVENLNLSLVEDTDNPVIDTLSPSSGGTDVAVNSTISFRLYDAMAGIDSSSVTSRMKVQGGTYYSQSPSVGSQQSTNQTRYYQYTGSYNPDSNIKTNSGYYEYATTYTIEASTDDLGSASTHSTTTEWSFTTEDDTDAPYITNFSPTDGSSGVAVDTNISFRVKDYKNNAGTIPGLGVDDDSILIVVNSDSTGANNYTCDSDEITCNTSNSNNVLVTLNPPSDFSENETVTVQIGADDLHSPANSMTTSSYSFTTEDTAAPVVSGFTPTVNSTGNASSTNISFHVTDGGAGVAIETLDIYVNDDNYTATSDEVTLTGDASDYLIEIDPATNFTEDTAVVTRISVQDQASSPNSISPDPSLYTFMIGLEASTVTTTVTTTVEIEGDCPECPSCGGGGGVIYIEKECPEIVCEECQECEDVFCPVCPSVPTTSGGSNPSSGGSSGGGGGTIIQNTSSGGGVINSGGGVIEEDEGVGSVVVKLQLTEVELKKINNRTLAKNKYLSISASEKEISFYGTTNAEEDMLLPILIYEQNNKDDKPLVFNQAIGKGGEFLLTLRNVFTPGNYNLTSLIYNEDGELGEISLGTFNIKELNIVPLRTEEEQRKVETKYNYSVLSVFLLIITISLVVMFLTRSFAGGVGFASTFVASILGIVIIAINQQNKAIIVEDSSAEKIIEELDVKEEYEELITENKEIIEELQKQVIDPLTGDPLENVTIEYDEQKGVTNQDGVFNLSQVGTDGRLKLSLPGYDKPVYLQVSELDGDIIYLSKPLLESLASIELKNSQRKFKQIYSYSVSDFQEIINEDLFVKEKNNALLNRIKQMKIAQALFDPNITILTDWTSPSLGKKYNKVAMVDFVYSGFNDNKGLMKIKEPWYFIEEGGEWRFVE